MSHTTNNADFDDEGEKTKLDYDEKTRKGELAVKVICLGDSAVGKSKLLERYLVDSYKHQQLSTFALTLYRHRTTVNGKPVLVDFWDTAGQERFQTLHASYYHQAHAAVLVFDGTRKITYKNLSTWYTELREHRPEIPALCAVNKIDDNEEIGGKSFAFPKKHNIPLYYVSASAGTNVVKLPRVRPMEGTLYVMKPGVLYTSRPALLSSIKDEQFIFKRIVVLFSDAIRAAYEYKLNPTDMSDQIMEELLLGEEDEEQQQQGAVEEGSYSSSREVVNKSNSGGKNGKEENTEKDEGGKNAKNGHQGKNGETAEADDAAVAL